MTHPEYIGPDIPGLVFVGNSGSDKTEAAALATYASHFTGKIPAEAFRVISHRFPRTTSDWRVVYCEQEYASVIEEWKAQLRSRLELLQLIAKLEDEGVDLGRWTS